MTEVRPRKITYTFTPADLSAIIIEHLINEDLDIEDGEVSVNYKISETRDAFDRQTGSYRLDSIEVSIEANK